MAVQTIAALKANMPIGTAGGTSVQDIHDIVDTFEDRAPAPSIIHGTVYLGNAPGVTTGSLPDSAARIANGTAIQAALDNAHTNNKWVELPPAKLHYEATKVVNSTNVGLQVQAGVLGIHGLYGPGGSYLVQHAADYPAITLGTPEPGQSNILYCREFSGFTVSHGIQGTANSRGVLLGSAANCKFDQIEVNRFGSGGGPFHPLVGWDHFANSVFFSNRIGGLFVGAGQRHLLRIASGGTGSTWDNVYLGGGSLGNLLTLTDQAMIIQNGGVQNVFNQLNIEWVTTYCMLHLFDTFALSFDSVHFEGCKPNNFNPSFIKSTGSQAHIRSLYYYSNDLKSGGYSGTASLIASDYDAALKVDVMACRFDSSGTGNIANARFRTYLPGGAGNTDGTRPILNISTARWDNHTAGMDLDSTLAGGTYGEIIRVGEYRFDKGRSRTVNAEIKAATGQGNVTAYGCHEHAKILIDSAITADRKVILHTKLAPSGFGSTVNRPVGDTVMVARSGNATGAFNILLRDQADTTTIATLSAVNTETRVIFDGTNFVTA